ncbi:MAG: peptidylprolyl isomerase [Planctomycetota bacterium]|jgi:peptidyl-prolyl cis-trans isomerase C
MKTGFFRLWNLVCLVILSANWAVVPGIAADTAKLTQGDRQVQGSSDVAVTVNGVDITEAAVDAEVALQFSKMRLPAEMPPQIVETYKKQLRQQALEEMIVEQMLEEEVKAAKIVITEEDVIAYLKESGSRQQPPLSLEDIKALIEAKGQNFDEVKKQIRASKGMKYQKLMEAQFAGKIKVTEEDAEKYYSQNTKQFETPEQVRASHILITPDTKDPNTDPNEAKVGAKAKTEELLKQVKAGADFAALAKTNSGCPSAAKGGDLGFFGRGRMVPSFEKAAFESKVGQVTDIVETRFGYHIIQVTARKDPNVVTFAQAKDDIMNRLTQQKQAELAKQYIESLKAKANIVYPPGKEPPELTRPPAIAPPIVRPGK